LYVGGDGVTRGYSGAPHLTAERFVPALYGDEPGARLYKSGDLVRWLPGGDMEFLGRIDKQIKLRGFRIELGETEFAFTRHRDVKDALVTVREDDSGRRRLVAYVLKNGGPASASDLREFVEQRLPDYMVPSSVVFLDSFPRTPSGKVDRRRLPDP